MAFLRKRPAVKNEHFSQPNKRPRLGGVSLPDINSLLHGNKSGEDGGSDATTTMNSHEAASTAQQQQQQQQQQQLSSSGLPNPSLSSPGRVTAGGGPPPISPHLYAAARALAPGLSYSGGGHFLDSPSGNSAGAAALKATHSSPNIPTWNQNNPISSSLPILGWLCANEASNNPPPKQSPRAAINLGNNNNSNNNNNNKQTTPPSPTHNSLSRTFSLPTLHPFPELEHNKLVSTSPRVSRTTSTSLSSSSSSSFPPPPTNDQQLYKLWLKFEKRRQYFTELQTNLTTIERDLDHSRAKNRELKGKIDEETKLFPTRNFLNGSELERIFSQQEGQINDLEIQSSLAQQQLNHVVFENSRLQMAYKDQEKTQSSTTISLLNEWQKERKIPMVVKPAQLKKKEKGREKEKEEREVGGGKEKGEMEVLGEKGEGEKGGQQEEKEGKEQKRKENEEKDKDKDKEQEKEKKKEKEKEKEKGKGKKGGKGEEKEKNQEKNQEKEKGSRERVKEKEKENEKEKQKEKGKPRTRGKGGK